MLSEKFKTIRKKLNINTQEELANTLEMKVSRVQDIERGKVKELKANEIINLQEKLLINYWWILTGKENILIEENKEIKYKEENIKNIEKLSDKQQEYIYHLIKAELAKEI